MQSVSRMSSSCKDRPFTNSKLLSCYTSHTRCQSVLKQAPKHDNKSQKLQTQIISSRKHNSTYKNGRSDYLAKEPLSPYRTSFSSTKGRRAKNTYNDNIICQSSYNLKDCSLSRQMMNSSQLFNSLHMQPNEMAYFVEKDNKQSLRSAHNRKKKPSSLKNQATKKLLMQNQNLMSSHWKKSQQNLKALFQRSKSKQTALNKEHKKNKVQKYGRQSFILSSTQKGSNMMLNSSGGLTGPYSDMLSRTFDILNKYEKKMKKLYEDKVTFQRLYEKSKTECQCLRKSIKNKQKGHYQPQKSTHTKEKDIRATKDSLKISLDTFKK